MSENSKAIENPDQILNDVDDNDSNNSTATIGMQVEQAWDRDSVIRMATDDFIKALPKASALSTDDLRNGLTNAIIAAIDERNVVQGGTKVQTIQSLPNACVAKLILAKYHVRCISWTGRRNDGNLVGVFQEDGDDKGIYVGSDAYFNQLVRDFKFTATKKDVDEVMEILEADAPFAKPSTDPDMIPVNNGIFNYKTKQLVPYNPEMVFTRKSRVNYPVAYTPRNPHIPMPDGVVWDFESWLGGLSDDPDIVELLLKTCGAIIRPNVRWDKIIALTGPEGLNGKGTLCELMKQLCGDGSYASIKIQDFEKEAKVAQLIHAMAVICDENGTSDFTKDVSNLKAITTGDDVSIDRKYKDAITFKFSGLVVECLNAKGIRTGDQTPSLYRRILPIPMDKSFKGTERKYIKSDFLRRPEVLEYVLWRVLNLPDYYDLPEPEACKRLLSDYMEFNDPVLQFVNEVFPEFSWEKVPQCFVFDLYLKWCQKNNPSGKLVGKHGVINKVKQYVRSKYSDTWMFNEDKVCINKNDNLHPELMIANYGLDDWRSKTYKGTDPAKLSMPQFKKSYRNVFVKVGCDTEEDNDNED